MITITVYGSSNAPKGFEIAGHANYAEEGYDIICASVSALAISCANGLEALVQCPVKTIINEETGYIKVLLSGEPSEKQLEQAELLIKVMLLSLKDISEQYPQYVRLLYKNGGNQHD